MVATNCLSDVCTDLTKSTVSLTVHCVKWHDSALWCNKAYLTILLPWGYKRKLLEDIANTDLGAASQSSCFL